MAGPLDFTGQNIEDTYQRIVQVSGSGFCDGTGSAVSIGELQISSDGNNRILTSNGDGTLTAESSLTINNGGLVGQFTSVGIQSNEFDFDGGKIVNSDITIDGPNGHITASGNISASGNLIINEITASGNISASNNITANGVTAQINITPEYASDNRAHELIFGDVPDGGGFTTLKAEQHPSISRRLSYTPNTGILDVYNLNVNNKIRISGSVVVDAAVGETQIGNTSDNRTLIQSPRLEASNLNITSSISASIISASGELIGIIDGGTF